MAWNPILVRGTGPIVRPILDQSDPVQLRGPAVLCKADDDDLLRPLWDRRVIVTIDPVVDSDPDPAALDASGQALHCVWRFPANQSVQFPPIQDGLRHLPQWSANAEDFYVESNAGSFRIPHGWSLYFGGGALDSRWLVTVTHEQDFNGTLPAKYALDTAVIAVPAPVPVIRPAYHYAIEVIAGNLLVAGAIPVLPTAGEPLSLAFPAITATAGTIYRTFTRL